jgi:hypothetical protein
MAENRLSSTSKADSNEKIGEFWDSHDFPARGSATYAVARNKGSLTSHDMYPRLTPQALRYPSAPWTFHLRPATLSWQLSNSKVAFRSRRLLSAPNPQ